MSELNSGGGDKDSCFEVVPRLTAYGGKWQPVSNQILKLNSSSRCLCETGWKRDAKKLISPCRSVNFAPLTYSMPAFPNRRTRLVGQITSRERERLDSVVKKNFWPECRFFLLLRPCVHTTAARVLQYTAAGTLWAVA